MSRGINHKERSFSQKQQCAFLGNQLFRYFSTEKRNLNDYNFKLLLISDEDLAGDHLLAEAKFPLNKVLPQMQKKFQISLEKPDLRVSEKCKMHLKLLLN